MLTSPIKEYPDQTRSSPFSDKNTSPFQPSLMISSILLALSASACSGTPELPDGEAARRDPDRFLVTDCLLPGLLIGLGTEITYLGPPRPTKSSIRDCARQGGEYVLYDRANQQSALNVWSERAADGDPEAQTYVGEIHEKGLGVAPDHELAALWYRRAADQGYGRAQLNLGYLYEAGLGVDKDIGTAIEYYRKASGLTDGTLEYVSSLDIAQRESDAIQARRTSEQLAAMHQSLERSRSNYLKQKQINEVNQQELLSLRQEIDQRRRNVLADTGTDNDSRTTAALSDLASVERELADARMQQQRIRQALLSQQNQTREAQAALNSARLALADQQGDIAQREQTTVELQQKLQTAKDRESRLHDELALLHDRLGQAQTALVQQQDRYARQLEDVEKDATIRLGAAESQLLALEAELKHREATLAEQTDQLMALEAQLVQDNAALTTRDADRISLTGTAGLRIVIDEPPPVITRLSMSLKVTQDSGSLIRGWLAPAEQGVSLTINGRNQTLDEAATFTYRHDGEDRLDFVARDSKAGEVHLPLTVDVEPSTGNGYQSEGPPMSMLSSIDFGQFHALIIGNRDYDTLSDLISVEQDAMAIESLLKARYGFRTELLIDADHHDMLAALDRLSQRASDGDRVVIYYSGHSELDALGQNCYWLPVDFDVRNPDARISNAALTGIVDAMPARQVLVIADSCYTNTLSRLSLARRQLHRTAIDQASWYKAMADTRVRSVLTSGAVKPLPDPRNIQGHSVFAAALIEQLDRSDLSVIETSALYSKLMDPVVRTSRQLGSTQQPSYLPIRHAGHQAGDFLFVSVPLN